MIRHIVLFRWTESTTSHDVDRLHEALAQLPAAVDTIRAYHHGRNLVQGAGSWDYAIIADFDDLDGWHAYDTDLLHLEVRAQMGAHIAERAPARIELP
jgi:hypothetical protein